MSYYHNGRLIKIEPLDPEKRERKVKPIKRLDVSKINFSNSPIVGFSRQLKTEARNFKASQEARDRSDNRGFSVKVVNLTK